jgi:holo-[acyl-carrier protein] synthase
LASRNNGSHIADAFYVENSGKAVSGKVEKKGGWNSSAWGQTFKNGSRKVPRCRGRAELPLVRWLPESLVPVNRTPVRPFAFDQTRSPLDSEGDNRRKTLRHGRLGRQYFRLRNALMENPSDDSSRPLRGMVIVGIGTDIVEVVRIGKMIERHGEVFLNRVFTDDEIRYCQRRKEYTQHYAGRWAAKEAVMKTLGTGFSRGVGWRDIEVCSNRSGQPSIVLRGGAREFSQQAGVSGVLITISHCRAYATATAIAVGLIE